MMPKDVRRRVSFDVPEDRSRISPNDGVHAPLDLVVELDSSDVGVSTNSIARKSLVDDDLVDTSQYSRSRKKKKRIEHLEKSSKLKAGDALDISSSLDRDTSPKPSTCVDEQPGSESDTGSDAESEENEKEGVEEECPSGIDSSAEGDGLQIQNSNEAEAPPPAQTFADMQLDSRVSWAISKLGWLHPTPVQSYAVPAVLAGRDVLLSAPTGSGKTAAYSIPLANQICQDLKAREHAHANGPSALVIVPTRELASQVSSHLRKLLKYVHGVNVASLTAPSTKRENRKLTSSYKKPSSEAKSIVQDAKDDRKNSFNSFARSADVLVGTPAAVAAIRNDLGESLFRNISYVVLDEADLVLSFGHGADTHRALAGVPSTAQSMLVSATLDTEGLPELRKVLLRHPLTIKVSSSSGHALGQNGTVSSMSRASHYFARLRCSSDRYLVTYVMLRLNVISGKVLIFVSSIAAAFRLKLFLDHFKIRSAVLNSELPANSRVHFVEQYNAGIFDILIATDEIRQSETSKNSKAQARKRRNDEEASEKGSDADDVPIEGAVEEESRPPSRKRSRAKSETDTEFGVSRGIDFRGVAAVLNFDIPANKVSYTHRAGRTARAGASGTVLTLVVSDSEETAVVEMGTTCGIHIGPLAFRMEQIEAFRYRVEDSLRAVTDAAVRDARLSEVRREMINSDRLKDYFDDNPMDLDALKHDHALARHVPEHLARIPSYLLPPALRTAAINEPVVGGRPRARRRNHGGGSKRSGRKNDDPLKTFSASKPNLGSSRSRFKARHGGTIKKSKGGKKQSRNRPKYHA